MTSVKSKLGNIPVAVELSKSTQLPVASPAVIKVEKSKAVDAPLWSLLQTCAVGVTSALGGATILII